MRQEWSPEELLASWTPVDSDWKLVANKTGATRLGFCLLLKFFELEGRFPDLLEEIPAGCGGVHRRAGEGPGRRLREVLPDGPDRRIPPRAGPRSAGVPPGDPRGRGASNRVAGRGGVPGRADGGPAA
ncbi:DUF4158 domain-containing protein [Streptomyces sp. ISL-44]|nr:DUF4158 domain-containing protein [Streptomyces sp. ISL-44]